MIDLAKGGPEGSDLDDWNVMHHLVKLLMSGASHLSLHEHLCLKLGATKLGLPQGRIPIESCELRLRHHLMQLIGYLMLDLPSRMDVAWRARAIRYNHMLKDFRNAPARYEQMVTRFENWRYRL
jgi:hypothetical protein